MERTMEMRKIERFRKANQPTKTKPTGLTPVHPTVVTVIDNQGLDYESLTDEALAMAQIRALHQQASQTGVTALTSVRSANV